MAEVEVTAELLEKIGSGDESLYSLMGMGEEDLQALAAMGFDLYEQGRDEEARVMFEGLEAIHPGSHWGPAGLGALALKEEELEDAETQLRRAAELKDNDPSIHANLGETLLRKGDFEGAANEFTRALDLDPDQLDPGADRARAIIQGLETLVAHADELQKAAEEAGAG
jgi:Flp pilus assembly protein TadD